MGIAPSHNVKGGNVFNSETRDAVAAPPPADESKPAKGGKVHEYKGDWPLTRMYAEQNINPLDHIKD